MTGAGLLARGYRGKARMLVDESTGGRATSGRLHRRGTGHCRAGALGDRRHRRRGPAPPALARGAVVPDDQRGVASPAGGVRLVAATMRSPSVISPAVGRALRVDEPLGDDAADERLVEGANRPRTGQIGGGVEPAEDLAEPEARLLVGFGQLPPELGDAIDQGEQLEAGGPDLRVSLERLRSPGSRIAPKPASASASLSSASSGASCASVTAICSPHSPWLRSWRR